MNRFELQPLPASFDRHLERFKLNASRRQLTGQQGGHINRRMGQSLEFRDFGHYMIGDDIRHVDWRLSARHSYGQMSEHNRWMIRRFHAEEQLKMVISIDNRETMLLPAALPKLQIAFWIAEAISRVALSATEADKIFWHPLFGKRIWPVKTNAVLKKVSQEVLASPYTDQLNSEPLLRHLPPTGVWVIITDLYFGHQHDALLPAFSSLIKQAWNGRRWVILINLDSWPWEKEQLRSANRPLRILRRNDDLKVLVDTPYLNNTELAIKAYFNKVEQSMTRSAYDLDHWLWPSDLSMTAEKLFLAHFFSPASPLSRLFMRDAV